MAREGLTAPISPSWPEKVASGPFYTKLHRIDGENQLKSRETQRLLHFVRPSAISAGIKQKPKSKIEKEKSQQASTVFEEVRRQDDKIDGMDGEIDGMDGEIDVGSAH